MADEILRSLDAACSKGVVVLLDFGDYSYSQARLLTPSVVLRAMNMLVVSTLEGHKYSLFKFK